MARSTLTPLQIEILRLFAIEGARASTHYDEKAYTHRTEIRFPVGVHPTVRTKRPTIQVLRRHRLLQGSDVFGPWTITDRGRAILARIDRGEEYSL